MKTGPLLKLLCLLALSPLALHGQAADLSTDPQPGERVGGEREFSIGGSGASSKDFNDSLGGLSFSYGSYLNETLLLAVRQSVNYSNSRDDDAAWNGATKLALDQHLFPRGRLRPFFGISVGRIYGDVVRDSWTAGVEGGAKFYLQARTFISATAEYGWLFQNARGVEDRFDDGQWNWSLAVGFNF